MSRDTLSHYREELKGSLDNEFLRSALDAFATGYRQSRERAFASMDVAAMIQNVAEIKDRAAEDMDRLLERFTERAEATGARVHLAADADEANRIIAEIADKAGVKRIVKSKSMTSEEIRLNRALEHAGLKVTETDLGEWIIQLRHEGPSHMVMPAIHLSRHQVGDLFARFKDGVKTSDIGELVKVARQELRQAYFEADMGISGANAAVAETGTIGIVTNEGNARLVTTLPRVHVALFGLDKLVENLDQALDIFEVLPRNATGQAATSYVTWITGAGPWAEGTKEVHFVVLDNGRRAMAEDPIFREALRCVRCGACANVCPVYRLVGGHKMGHIYIGAIGLILTYFYHGAEAAEALAQNCINCGACREVCAGGIDLPRLIAEIRARIATERGRPASSRLLSLVMANRGLFHSLLKATAKARPLTADSEGHLRHLPMILSGQGFRPLPTLAKVPFRNWWKDHRPEVEDIEEPLRHAALFAGCAQDFVYPEQLRDAARLFTERGTALEFPMDQTCCGLPLRMMGEKKAAVDVAAQNVRAFADSGVEHVVTLCASCASHMKHDYPELLAGTELAEEGVRFADKVMDFSSYARDVLGLTPGEVAQDGTTATYHAPCHLCRGLGVHGAPRELLAVAGLEYVPCEEEETCCGFGGSYALKFPELSRTLLGRKLDNVAETGASILATDCPGCVMQLRGGMHARGADTEVLHMAEVLARALCRDAD